jgi:hypothetical protein
MTLDRRLYAYKDDVADAKLRGKVQALRYVTPELRQVTVSIAPVLREPRYDAPTDTQALLGEPVHVFPDQGRLGIRAAGHRPLCRLHSGTLPQQSGH